MTTVNSQVESSNHERGLRAGFWIVAYAFLIVVSMATLPSPLYGLYRVRDHLSALVITVIFAIYAASTIATLLVLQPIAARIGRRGVMISAVVTMMIAAGVLASWKALPGLFIGRLLTGVANGLAAGTAIAYLLELRLRADPKSPIGRARTIGTSINVGALGIGPLLAGLLAQWGKLQLTLPYLVVLGLGAIALASLWAVPETGAPMPHPAPHPEIHTTGPRTARLPVPAAAGTLAAFAANGLFAGLSGLVLATTFHRTSHALAGATLFLVFTSGVVSQLVTAKLQASRVLLTGTVSMLMGLVLLVVSVRLAIPNLALFLVGGALIGAGSGAVFKGTTGIVLETSAPENRLHMTADLLIALYVGLSVPVVGAGIALNAGASSSNTVLVFAILVGLGVSVSGWALIGRRPKDSAQSS
jgi:predicted MFS family arabinose efflux permease